jgi:hypothetical protein
MQRLLPNDLRHLIHSSREHLITLGIIEERVFDAQLKKYFEEMQRGVYLPAERVCIRKD